jgi:ubiquinone/menaquinone biosynthesis C-methylase UbiE
MTPDDHPDAAATYADSHADACRRGEAVPSYLVEHYRWAYLDPGAIAFFDQGWVVNLILWGQFHRLSECAFAALGDAQPGSRTLQVACVYGDLSPRLASRIGADAQLDIVDVVPQQLRNVARKLAGRAGVTLTLSNSAELPCADGRYDRALVFFLLHEQPENVRRATLAETLRVVRPGGRIVIVDYHRPVRLNPLRYLMRLVLQRLEPFALDLWRAPLQTWLPSRGFRTLRHEVLFGGLYQILVLEAEAKDGVA